MEQREQYLTVQEMIDRYNGRISKSTFARWRATHHGPRWSRFGLRILYPLSEVQSWEERQRMKDLSSEFQAAMQSRPPTPKKVGKP